MNRLRLFLLGAGILSTAVAATAASAFSWSEEPAPTDSPVRTFALVHHTVEGTSPTLALAALEITSTEPGVLLRRALPGDESVKFVGGEAGARGVTAVVWNVAEEPGVGLPDGAVVLRVEVMAREGAVGLEARASARAGGLLAWSGHRVLEERPLAATDTAAPPAASSDVN
jgi:hypothetical protein